MQIRRAKPKLLIVISLTLVLNAFSISDWYNGYKVPPIMAVQPIQQYIILTLLAEPH
jgi:hypothetical protein